MTRPALAAAVAVTTLCFASNLALAQRAVGIDVSSWQGSINWATVAKPKAEGGGGIQFAFIRASRGRPDAADTTPFLDSTYAYNISQAKLNGVIPGAYHYARYDVNDALGEANDFLSVARNHIGPGYLPPVLDLEQASSLTTSQLSTWALTFSQRVYDVTGVRPIIYANSSFARDEVSGTTWLNGVTLRNHDFWLARYTYTSAQNPTQATRDYWTQQTQTIAPPTPSGFSNPYGIWNGVGNSWDFWQYTDAGRTPGITGNVDQDVANGDIEFVRNMVPAAVWTNTAGGNFGSNNMWNRSADDVANNRTTTLFPDLNSRAIISLPSANVTVTYNGMNRTVRSLQADEAMNFVSGTLTGVQYLNFTAAVNVSGVVSGTGASGFTAPTISNAGTLTLTGGTVAASGAITYPVGTSATINVSGGVLSAASARQSRFNISGGTVNVAGEMGGNFVIVSGGTLSAGTLAVSSSLTMTGGVANIGVLSPGEPTTVRGNAVLNAGSITRAQLNVSETGHVNLTGTGGSKLSSLNVATTARLDLGLTELAVDYTGTSPLSSYRAALAAGAITSDKASPGVLGIGAVEATARFGATFTGGTYGDVTPVSIDATTVLLQLALFGDANLSGTVDVADLGILATRYGSTGDWHDGDTNYDGVADVADLGRLATNYGKTLLPDGTVVGGNPAQFAADVQLFANLVPEPAALAALAPLAIAMRRRRRAV